MFVCVEAVYQGMCMYLRGRYGCVHVPPNRPRYVHILVGVYLHKIDLVYNGADSIKLNWFNKVFYKLQYYSIYGFL